MARTRISQWVNSGNNDPMEIVKYEIIIENISNVNYTIRVLNIDNKNPKEVIMEIQFNGPDFKFKANLNYDDAVIVVTYLEAFSHGIQFVYGGGSARPNSMRLSAGEEDRRE